MAIITISNFNGTVNNIPNLNKDYITEQMQAYIDTFEPEYLNKMLGYELQKAISVTTPDARFNDLIKGGEFTYNGELMKWDGLEGDNSPIADFIMYKYLTLTSTRTTGTGEAKAKNVNASVVSVDNKVMNVWNAMVDKNKTLHLFLKSGTYPEYKGIREQSLFSKFNIFGITT